MFCEVSLLERFDFLIGCDEVGRGPLAGPVVGCAVKIGASEEGLLEYLRSLSITDSKKLSKAKRRRILEQLNCPREKIVGNSQEKVFFSHGSFTYALCEHSPLEIDRMNILRASLSCMQRAANSLHEPECRAKVLVDGNFGFPVASGDEALAIIKGDSKSLCIALASIIAKEYRDLRMEELAKTYPGYGLDKHAGYPTKEHKQALIELGVSPIHRQSFKGVKELLG